MTHLLTCLCVLVLALAAAPARAQDPQVDPSSPAGREYELPIDSARDQARSTSDAGGGSKGGAGGEPPLFGAGVESKSNTPNNNTKSGTDSDPATIAGVEPDAGTSTPETVRAQAPAPDGGGMDAGGGGPGLLVVVGAAFGILLIGGLAGLALRRRPIAS